MIKQRQASLPGFDLKDLVAESIAFIQQHEPPEGYFVGFSGGKDSITLLELCKMAGVKYEACYSCTRIDPPEVVRFIRQHHPDVTWLYPKDSFWNMVVKKKTTPENAALVLRLPQEGTGGCSPAPLPPHGDQG